jgi:hypothetical protein
MCFDPYILERITTTRLNELRAEAARRTTLASVMRDQPGVWDTVRLMLRRAGRVFGRRGMVRPRHA